MDEGLSKITYWKAKRSKSGLAVAFILAGISVLPLIFALTVLLSKTGVSSALTRLTEPELQASLTFTLYQAVYSALIVVLFSPILALALFALPIWSMRSSMLIRITSFCLPSIVVASGLVLAWGNNGYFTQILRYIGLESPFPKILYSPQAIVWANSLMNVPFCSAILFRRVLDLPIEQLRSAEILGLNPKNVIKFIIWPALRPILLYFGGLSFLMSMGSFGALSILGGGPQAQTLEMAIYHAIYSAADWELAGVLTLIHTILCGLFASLTIWNLNRSALGKSGSKVTLTVYSNIRSLLFQSRQMIYMSICLTILFDGLVLSPIIALIFEAGRHVVSGSLTATSAILISAIQVSISFAIPAAILITISVWLLSRAYHRAINQGDKKVANILQFATFSAAVVPPMALGFGFLVLQSRGDFFSARQPVIASALTSAMLPFALSFFMPAYGSRLASGNQSRLLLGLKESTFCKRVEWPALRLSFVIVFALSLALCLNETSIVTMLGDATSPALTTTMIRLMNQYRFGDSALVATLLIFITSFIVLYFYKSEGVNDA
jgi:thiamine transport system permease protein